jgi:undecaprenyl diphosphate synthase
VQRWQAAHPKADARSITQEQLAKYLSTVHMPDPDLLIRTGGEQRISNFLLWQVAYAELYFTDVLWPEFDTSQMQLSLNWYRTRQRRFGQVDEFKS